MKFDSKNKEKFLYFWWTGLAFILPSMLKNQIFFSALKLMNGKQKEKKVKTQKDI